MATPEQVDRICRLGGGFRMGPFELMDLVGIDVGFAVAQSFTELSFGEPRWKPSPLQARMVAAGRLGRKTGGAGTSTATARTGPTTRRPRDGVGADFERRGRRGRAGALRRAHPRLATATRRWWASTCCRAPAWWS